MDVIRLRRGPNEQSMSELITTKDTFSVRFRNPISNAQSAKTPRKGVVAVKVLQLRVSRQF